MELFDGYIIEIFVSRKEELGILQKNLNEIKKRKEAKEI